MKAHLQSLVELGLSRLLFGHHARSYPHTGGSMMTLSLVCLVWAPLLEASGLYKFACGPLRCREGDCRVVGGRRAEPKLP